MRPIRVLYVEDDPALRGILASALLEEPELEIAATVASAQEAIRTAGSLRFDVALLDLSLGRESINGFELGIQLRNISPQMGIVIYSQHVVSDFTNNLPEDQRMGWSAIRKKSKLDITYLTQVLRSTAEGKSTVEPEMVESPIRSAENLLAKLSMRQRNIMYLATTGVDATVIAGELELAPVTVRKELSKIYQILVPDPKPGTDLRTTAVLRYLRETRAYGSNFDKE
jgi:two-component system, NarL family, response regulator DesR